MSEYNLNEIEAYVNTELFTSIIIDDTKQLNFTSEEDVRAFAKGPGNLPVHVMMNRMIEVMFGHYSTCFNIKHSQLSTMFVKLFCGWCQKLAMKNRVLGEPNEEYDFDHHIHNKRVGFDQHHKLGNDDIKDVIKGQQLAFNADHRTQKEIQKLLSKYVFKVASTYYNIPFNKDVQVQLLYIRLRTNIIEQWTVVTNSHKLLREMDPEEMFKTLDPKTVAMEYFPQNIVLFRKQLDKRFRRFKRWHKKESSVAVNNANDPKYRQVVINKWDNALLYAKALYDGMKHKELEKGR